MALEKGQKVVKVNDGDDVLCPGCGSWNHNIFHKIHGHCSDCGIDFEVQWIKPKPLPAPAPVKGITPEQVNDYRQRVLADQERRGE